MKRIAVLLSGCGVFDGSEINEAVLSLLAIASQGASYQCFAPNIEQLHVVNHLTGEVESNQVRNVLVESARIARGEILDTEQLNIELFDGLIIPGGFGAAKNLCDFAVKGALCQVNPIVDKFVQQFIAAGKPIGFICIAPVMIPHFVKGATGTIGQDADTAAAFEQMGGIHQVVNVDEIVVDEQHKIISTPAYMLAQSIVEANQGIQKLVAKVIELA